MSDVVQLIGWFALLFGASVAAAFVLTRGKRARSRGQFAIAPDTPIRISAASGSYRSRFLMSTSDGWVISAPMQRDVFVPLRVGEKLVVQVPGRRGLWTFRATVLERQLDGHMLVLDPPKNPQCIERRAARRTSTPETRGAMLNGCPADLCDVSEGGARLLTNAPLANGDPIILTASHEDEEVRGWALECAPIRQGDGRRIVRVCFSEPALKLAAKKGSPFR